MHIHFSFGQKTAQFFPMYLRTLLPELIKNHKPQVLSKSEKHLPTSRALYAAGQQLQLKGDTSEAAKVVVCLDTETIWNCSPD